jgi:hypothetical protein
LAAAKKQKRVQQALLEFQKEPIANKEQIVYIAPYQLHTVHAGWWHCRSAES